MRLLLVLAMLLGFEVAFSALPAASSLGGSCSGEVRLTKLAGKDYPVCIINDSVISQEFMQVQEPTKWSQAVEAYVFRKKGEVRLGGICGAYASELLITKDPQNEAYNLCQFSDGSFIDETTLWMGPGHNEDLDVELRSIGISNSL